VISHAIDGAALGTGDPLALRDARRARRRWQAACLAALALLAVLTVVAATVGVLPGDPELRSTLVALATPEVIALARIVNPGGSWVVLLPGMLAVFALSPDVRRRWWLWSAVFIGGALVEQALKTGVARARPEDLSAGFPSGHATSAAAFAVIVVYAASRSRLSPGVRAAICAAALTGGCLVGLARIELRAHWPSDVVAGWALGTALAAGAAWWSLAPGAGAPSRVGRRGLGAAPADRPRAARG
jgi:membrane-associated phospholipid phosphatase